MRVVTGYINGKSQWSDNVPAAASMGAIRGSLVEGGPAGDSLYIPTKHEAKARADREAARYAARKAAREAA